MQEESIFIEALEKQDPGERAAFLTQVCAGNADLRQRIERLLQRHEQADSLLDSPAVAQIPTLDEPIKERPGTVIGPYKLLEQIGEGGFGVVFMAEQQQPVRRKVALKVIKPGMDTRQVIARFEAERQALALMDHPNIARVLEAGTIGRPNAPREEVPHAEREVYGSRPYFVMELVRGASMTDYCDQHNLPVRDRLELFVDVCQAVQHAHQKGIIHRDIKPSNVLITLHDGKPVVKVIDFGIAKAMGQQLTEKTLFTNFAQMIGTPLYMSPEQAEMSGLDVDTRSDIYSLGVLLYELLTGTTPYDKERLKTASFDEIRRIIREEEPPKPSTRMSTLGQVATTASAKRQSDPRKLSRLFRGELDWIVMKALEKDRNRRYETASAFAADVGRYLKDEAVLACPPSAGYRFGKFARRHKTRLAFAGLMFFFLVALGSGIGWAIGDRSSRRTSAATRFDGALAQAAAYMQAENWPEAKAAAQRAGGLLTGAGGDDSLHQRLAQVEADLDMVAKLELARLQKAAIKDGHFDTQGADPAYVDAFHNYNLPVMDLEPNEAAGRIADSAIREQLLAALVDWANLKTDPADKQKLTAILRLADNGQWRQQVFDALDDKDWPRLARMTGQAEALGQPPTRILALGNILAQTDLPGAVEFLRKAQRRHPDDFWINHDLAYVLHKLGPNHLEEALRYYTAAVALRPLSPGVHVNFGVALFDKGQLDEAIAEEREAIRLKRDFAAAHLDLGMALNGKGRLDEAIAEYREAIRLKKDEPFAHNNLGNALREKGQLDEAITECQEAIRLRKDYREAHCNLGAALHNKGRLDEAIVEYQETIRLDPNHVMGYYHLGLALRDKGRPDEAIAEFRRAIRIDKNDAKSHAALGSVLMDTGRLDEAAIELREGIRLNKDDPIAHLDFGNLIGRIGQPDEAIAEYREAIRLKKDYTDAYLNLGATLCDQKKDYDGAVSALQEAIRLKPDDAFPHLNLGVALTEQGNLAGAIREYRAAIVIDPKFALAHKYLQRTERLAELDIKLPKILNGQAQPKDAAERLAVADLCRQSSRRLNATAARFYAEAFVADSKLADDFIAYDRHRAACVAALAGCGRGKDASGLDDKERERLRRQALAWLRADLGALQRLESVVNKDRPLVQGAMRLWQQDEAFAGVRGESLAKLPEAERQEWQKLWQEVEELCKRASQEKRP